MKLRPHLTWDPCRESNWSYR